MITLALLASLAFPPAPEPGRLGIHLYRPPVLKFYDGGLSKRVGRQRFALDGSVDRRIKRRGVTLVASWRIRW